MYLFLVFLYLNKIDFTKLNELFYLIYNFKQLVVNEYYNVISNLVA